MPVDFPASPAFPSFPSIAERVNINNPVGLRSRSVSVLCVTLNRQMQAFRYDLITADWRETVLYVLWCCVFLLYYCSGGIHK